MECDVKNKLLCVGRAHRHKGDYGSKVLSRCWCVTRIS